MKLVVEDSRRLLGAFEGHGFVAAADDERGGEHTGAAHSHVPEEITTR